MERVPREVEIRGIYFPPLLLCGILGLLLAWLTLIALYRLRWDHYIEAPTIAFLALSVIYAVILSTWVIPS
ncbi:MULTISPECIES: DUF1656 domain-containing protein [Aphanothece]|uniref:DUF1656 domain-containing protein n=1 Tax=Aphanothece TaxID=1121 RepID=UPI0039854DB7